MQKRKRLLNRKESKAFHIGIENRVKKLFGYRAERRKLRNTGICEQDIEPALIAYDLSEQPVEIAQIRYISLDAGHIVADFGHRRGQLGIAAPRCEYVCAFDHKKFRGGESDAGAASGD